MGSSTSRYSTLETTLISCEKDGKDLLIKCDPPIESNFDRLYLERRHPNYIKLHNELTTGQSFKITYEFARVYWWLFAEFNIKNIEFCDKHELKTKVEGFLNMNIIDPDLADYKLVVCDGNIQLLTLTEFECDIPCVITYVKFCKADYYLIEKVTF